MLLQHVGGLTCNFQRKKSTISHSLVTLPVGDRQIKLPFLRNRESKCGRARTQSWRRSATVMLGTPFAALESECKQTGSSRGDEGANKRGGQKAARLSRGKQTCRKHLFLPVHRPYII